MVFIILNMLSMAIDFEDKSDTFTLVLEIINYVFTSIFAIEAMFKFIAFGPLMYIKSNWNKFDLFVVCASFFEIFMRMLNTNSLKFLRVGPQLARIMRVLRVS